VTKKTEDCHGSRGTVIAKPRSGCGNLSETLAATDCQLAEYSQRIMDSSFRVKDAVLNRGISQPLSAAEDCHGPAGLAKTGRASPDCTEDCRGPGGLAKTRRASPDCTGDCHGPAGLAKTGWQSASGRRLTRRTLVTAGRRPPSLLALFCRGGGLLVPGV
jgi:hypothetical protein